MAITADSGVVEFGALSGKQNQPVKFSDLLRNPQVMLSIVGLDYERTANLRIRVNKSSVSNGGFELIAETWADTKIWDLRVAWLAVSSQDVDSPKEQG